MLVHCLQLALVSRLSDKDNPFIAQWYWKFAKFTNAKLVKFAEYIGVSNVLVHLLMVHLDFAYDSGIRVTWPSEIGIRNPLRRAPLHAPNRLQTLAVDVMRSVMYFAPNERQAKWKQLFGTKLVQLQATFDARSRLVAVVGLPWPAIIQMFGLPSFMRSGISRKYAVAHISYSDASTHVNKRMTKSRAIISAAEIATVLYEVEFDLP